MTEDDLSDALQAYLKTIDAEASVLQPGRTALAHIIRDHMNAPRPTGPYAMITFIGSRDLGEADQPCYGTATVDGVERVTETRVRSSEYKFRIDVYAPRATDYTRLFERALRSERAGVEMGGLVVRHVDGVAQSPELVQQKWEGRANFTVELAALTREKMLIDVIESGDIQFDGVGATATNRELHFEKG